MASAVPARRRPRPVADAPIVGLLGRTPELARAWLLALLEETPLEDAARLLTEPFTRDGPRVCDAVLRALADEDDLRRLTAGGALRPLASRTGELVGARDAAAAMHAIDSLLSVLWAALLGELSGVDAADAGLVSALSERLAQVVGLLREAVLTGPEITLRPARGGLGLARSEGATSPSRPESTRSRPDPPRSDASPPGSARSELARSDLPRPASGRSDPPHPEPRWSGPAPAGPADGRTSWIGSASRGVNGTVSWDGFPPDGGQPPDGEADPLWWDALADEVDRSSSQAMPLSLLLTELEDADRVFASASPERAGEALGEFTDALRSALRVQDILVCDGETRAWVIARETTRTGAHALGARMAEAVGTTASLGGVPLVACVGIAVLGEDGTSGDELIDAAEEARFAASARGVEVARRVPAHER